MSSSSNNNNQGKATVQRAIQNPYAKKKSTASSQAASSPSAGLNISQQQKQQPQRSQVISSNPYARKIASTSSKSPTSANHGTRRSSFSPLEPVEGATSFSQAFSSIEDTQHFQRALEDSRKHNSDDRPLVFSEEEQAERRQQRALDAATTSTNSRTNNDIVEDYQTSNQLSDRQVQAALVGTSANPHVLYVSPKQRGNIVLDYIKNVPVTFLRMVPDYIFSATQCALFLSLKYHSLYPNYIHRRIAELERDFQLRVLLVLVDIQDNAPALLQLNTLCVTNRLTLILAWTAEEAARYLESYKALQGKDASLIQKRTSTNFADQVADFLTACPSVNKTDAANLLGQFRSMQALLTKGTPEELTLVTGMGHVKVTRLYEALHKPFSKRLARKRRKLRQEQKDKEREQELDPLPNNEKQSTAEKKRDT